MVVKHCCYGVCKNDNRYPERSGGVSFFPFIKPSTDREKCLRWIKACGRPHSQLNVGNITKYTYICGKHFHDGHPSEEYPDPVPYDGSKMTKARRCLKRRLPTECAQSATDEQEMVDDEENDVPNNEKSTQTEETLFSSLDMLAAYSRIHELESSLKRLQEEITQQRKEMKKKAIEHRNERQHRSSLHAAEKTQLQAKIKHHQQLFMNISKPAAFSIKAVNESKVKNLFTFYTGLTYEVFLGLFEMLLEGSDSIEYTETRSDIHVPLKEQLFLTLCRLRKGFHLKDIALRFGLSPQASAVVFNSWVRLMFLKFSKISWWPKRETLISMMPKDYREKYPRTLAIIDCTEIRCEVPSGLIEQSQMYSDYKSSTTLKSLVVVDPRGSVMFVSGLYTGSISDNEICKESGFYDLLRDQIAKGHINSGDAIMADKGFKIEKDLEDLGLGLNRPPFASAGVPMAAADVRDTRTIAAHRIHVERAIRQIKTFKFLTKTIPISLFHSIDEAWFVCSMLTNFQNTLVKLC